jgi:hypothetical protein
VERVVAERAGVDGTVKYLIKWKGVPYSECTWESADDTSRHNGQEEVDAFLARERRVVEASNAVQYARERFKIRCGLGGPGGLAQAWGPGRGLVGWGPGARGPGG